MFGKQKEDTELHLKKMELIKRSDGSIIVAIYDERDLTREQALSIAKSGASDDRLVIMSDAQFRRVCRSAFKMDE